MKGPIYLKCRLWEGDSLEERLEGRLEPAVQSLRCLLMPLGSRLGPVASDAGRDMGSPSGYRKAFVLHLQKKKKDHSLA